MNAEQGITTDELQYQKFKSQVNGVFTGMIVTGIYTILTVVITNLIWHSSL